jgi:hypothetical protein
MTKSSIERLHGSVPIDFDQLEADVEALPSPKAPSYRLQPMPDYVAHQEGVPRVGALSAEAVVRDYETAAKEIEAMGAELISAAKKCEQMTTQVHGAFAYMQDTAKAYREEAKKIFQRIEECSKLTQEVHKICETLKHRIEGNTTHQLSANDFHIV